ncbi:MAG: hypothetical protein L0Z50_14830 [Verrucomicrobiales bacterium]|nr:hypothetical protein [Verrucomicrobiales bacterium]
MNSKHPHRSGRHWPAALALASVLVLGRVPSQAAEPSGIGPTNSTDAPLVSLAPDSLRFRNGDVLFGKLLMIEVETGLRWNHPDAPEPINFKLDNVLELLLRDTQPNHSVASNTCLVRLTNQDEFSGHLTRFDSDKLVLDTWYAGSLVIPRKMVQFVQPKPLPASPIFTGPTGLEGWTIGKLSAAVAEAGEWRYRNGAFYATRAASIARDVKLPDASNLEFDLSWRGSFHLAIALYTDYLQPVSLSSKESEPDFGGFYSLQLNNYYANLLPVTKSDPIRYLGQIPLQSSGLGQKDSAHIEIRANKSRNLIALLIDGTLVKMWIDTQEFVGKGTGIRIVHQGQGASKITNLRVSEWDGQFEEKPTNPPDSRQDLVKLRNGDKLGGTVELVHEGKMLFALAGKTIEVPLNRVKQMELAGARLERPQGSVQEMRGFFARGGSVTFDLEKLDENGWIAKSPIFGKTTFHRAAFSRVDFEPGGAKRNP